MLRLEMNAARNIARTAPPVAVRPTTDFGYLRSLIEHPGMWAKVADDNCSKLGLLDYLKLALSPGVLLLEVLVAGNPAGAFLLLPVESGFDVHTILTERCRGHRALAAGRAGIDFVFQHTDAERITSRCPQDNPAAFWFALRNGFVVCGWDRDWIRNGQNVNTAHVELTRADWRRTRLCQ